MTYYSNNIEITNSTFDKGSLSAAYYAINLYYSYSNKDSGLIQNNIIKNYYYGIYLHYLYRGLEIYDNYIHNNTSYGIYINQIGYSTYGLSNPIVFARNRIVDNNYGVYKADSSSSWGRYIEFKDNLIKSSSSYGIYCYYYCQDWTVENNTFDGDSDQTYGFYSYYRSYRTVFGNNTFTGHTSKDIYLRQCGTGTNSNKFFDNTYSSITVTGSCRIDVYNTLNVKTVEEDGDAFSSVEIEIKDGSKTYYETPHWGGSDDLTDSSGYISKSLFMVSGYYTTSTITPNNITVNLAYGVRAKSTWTNFDADTTKSFTVPDAFRYGVVKNTNTSTIYTSFSSAISAASTDNVLHVWAWTYNENVVITEGVTLIGNSTATAIINGGTGDYSIEVKSDGVTIKNLTLNGATDSLLYAGNYDNLNVENVIMTSSSSNYGIYFDRTGQSTIASVTINLTDRKSVFVTDGDTITFKDSHFKNSSSSHGFEIVDSEDIILDNVFIHNSGYAGSSAYGLSISNSDSITVRNSTKVASSKDYELYVNDVSNLKIQNSIFSGKNLALIEISDSFVIESNVFKDSSNGDYGVYIKNTDSATFKDNTIKNSAADGGSDYGAVYLTASSSNLIQNNTITNSGKSGIHLKSSSEDNKIYGNTVTSSHFSGLYVQSSDGTLIRNNTFSNSGVHGIKLSSSDDTVVDNNTLTSNTDYGLYVTSSEDLIVKSNSISNNDDGIYVNNADDAIISSNTVEDHDSYGIYFSDSKRVKIKKNVIKTNNGDALFLSSNCDDAFVDNNTIKNNGDSDSGKALRLYEADNAVIYNNTIESNDYSGIVITASSSNKIVGNTIKGNGKYGIGITNDLTRSANNTIKDNTINDNQDWAVYVNGIYTDVINNTIKYNEKDGIHVSSAGARTTIQQNTIEDNEENAIHIAANNALITSNSIDGDTSEMAILILDSRSSSITNNTVEGGEHAIKVQNSTSVFVYNNTIKDNSGHGIYLLLGSHSGDVKYNTVKSNEDDGISIQSSDSVEVLGNTITDNNGYGIVTGSSKLVELKNNTLKENDGGVKYVDCDYCNLTYMTIVDNGGRGIWFSSGSDNNYIKHTNSSDSSVKDVYLQDSSDNTAFNFTFSTISVNSNSTLTITSNLEIVFQDSDGDGFQGIDFALLTKGVKVYSTPFYGGTDAVSDSNGEAGATFSLEYRIYNGSSTPDNIANIIKYHYGVRSKEKSIDMSTSHTETVSVPSYWVKGLVKNIDSGSTWYKIQDAIDNSSSGDTLHIWAWTYSENVEVDESITIIGNGTGNTTLNATSSGKAFDITSDDVTIRDIKVEGCGSTTGYNGFQLIGDDITVENVIAKTCYRGVVIGGSGAWVGNSTITNNYNNGIDTSTTAVKIYKNTLSWNGNHGIKSLEDDIVIKSNIIRNNTGDGIHLDGAADSVIEGNTIADNYDGIEVYNGCPRVVIKNNDILDSEKRGIYISGATSNDGVIESNTVTNSGSNGILIQHSDYFYLGNTSVSGSNNYDLQFHKTTIGNSAKNTTFSTILIHENAYFAIYNDLTLKFMQNATVGFEGLEVKLVSDGSTKYATSYYSGTDSKTDSNGSISKDFTLKFRIYDGSSTPDEANTTLYYHYGVRAKSYNINMTISHTETVTVPAFWKKGLIENLDTGLQSSTIQDAIDNANSGDRLQLWEWDYVEYGIEVTERVTIFGNSSSVTVSGNWQDEIFSLETNSITLKNLTIQKSGNSTDDECIDIGVGSGIKVDNVILKNCNIGILVETSNVVISNVTVQNSAKDGIIVKSSGVTIENSTIKNNGRNGIELHANTVVYNNTIKDNQKDGINITADSNYAKILSNTIEDNDDQAISIYSSHHVSIKNNEIEDNDYGILLHYANFTQMHNNNIEENDVGGIKFVSTKYSNITSSIIKDNNGRGIWFTSTSDSNNLRDTASTGSSNNDIELDSSKRNTGFNFTFGSGKIGVDSNSDFRIMNSLNIKFVNGSSAFAGVDLELFNYDMVLYASPFYGGNDGVSGSDGFIDEELTVAYEIYNGSSTTEDVDTTLKYHYGVRGKSIEIDMSTSHTETVDVPSYWTKGLVRNVDTDTDYYKIQHAIDNASAGDTLHIWAWTYYENVEIDEELTIIGNGTGNTTLDGESSTDYVVDIETDDVTIKSLKIINGNSYSIMLAAIDDITLENIVVHNSGNWGIYAGISEDLEILNSVVSSSEGGIYSGSSTTIKDSNVIDNNNYGIYVSGPDIKVENSTVSGTTCNSSCSTNGHGMYIVGNSAFIYNNTISNNSGIGILSGSWYSNYVNNRVVDNGDHGIKTLDGDYQKIISNHLLRNTNSGLYMDRVFNYCKVEDNTIGNNDEYGIVLHGANYNYLWNNTLYSNDLKDLLVETQSNSNFAIGTTFSSIVVDGSSGLTIREYFVLDVNDASGDNMSGIDIKVMEDDTQKYASSYFGGSDPKTDSYGTIETFLIDFMIYNGSSTPTTIPTYVSARSHDWVETFTSDPSSTIQITVPDLRVQNTRTGTLTYHIQTALDDANSGDTIHAWAGTYYENLEINDDITLEGNGTSTIINGTYTGDAIKIEEDNVIIKNLTVISSSTGGDEAGIAVVDSEDVQILNVKFMDNVNGLYLEDAQDLTLSNSIFDVKDYGVYTSGSSSGLIIQDSQFRNGSSSNACIYQASSDENGGAQIIGTTFDNCYTGWKSGSSNNVFRDNTLKDNEYGIMLTGTEAYNNMISGNTIDDSEYGIYIYNTAHDNNLFNNEFDDSEEYDIRLSDSDDTVSYNNTFSDIFVSSDANMWIKVYIDLTVFDNSSNAFSNADVRIKEDNLVLYSTSYFGGSDAKTNSTGQIATFLVATSQYNGSSTPEAVTTTVSTRYSDWTETSTYNVNNAISVSVDDFRVLNEDTDEMYYTISGAVAESNMGDKLLIWTGTYRENVVINRELTLEGNGTSKTIINGSFSGDVITINADEVSIADVTISGSGSSNSGILVTEGVCSFTDLRFTYNYIGFTSTGKFNEITFSDFYYNTVGVYLSNDDNVVSNNYFSENNNGITVSNGTNENRLESNEITKSVWRGIYVNGAEEITINDNYIHNNTANGIYLNASHENIIHQNTLEYNSGDAFVVASGSGNSTIYNNTFDANDDSPVSLEFSFYNVFRDNAFTSNDDYFIIEGGAGNEVLSNTFDETGIQLLNSNNQIIIGNTISEAPKNGIRIFKSSSNNYLANNTISDSDDQDLYVGGSGSQNDNRGYNNTFSDIKVLSNGEFIVLDYIGIRTVNATGNMSGNDIKALYESDTLYASSYFDGDDPKTDSQGLIPDFLAPIEKYDGSSTPSKVITPITVRYSDWVETFDLDPYQGSSITATVPELRVKNNNTGSWSYYIQTSIDNAGANDVIIVSPGTYYENIVINRQGLTVQGPSETLNEDVVIDAQNSGSAVTISKNNIKFYGFNITNSFEWEDPFNSSGIKIQSDNNYVRHNKITNSYVGILFDSSENNNVVYNLIDDVDIGIMLTKSHSNIVDSNQILDSDVVDIQVTSFGYSSGSNDNSFSYNSGIEAITFTDSDSNTLDDQQVGTYTLVNSKRISVYQSSYDYVVCDSDSTLYLKNWMNINVSRNGSSMSDVDIKVWDGNNVIYSTSYFGGSDQVTDSQGKAPSDIVVIYRVFNGSSTSTDNTTEVKIRVGDWFKTSTSETDENRADIDFDVPEFRITNLDTDIEYNYIQRAIDNATAGDIISLGSGEYNENVVIDKRLTLRGYSTEDTIITSETGGLGSPPLFDTSQSAILITADNAIVENLQVSGSFSEGVEISYADNVFIHNLEIVDIESTGIFVNNSVDVKLVDMYVESSGGDGILVEGISSGFIITDSILINNDLSGIEIDDGAVNAYIHNVTLSNNLYGCHCLGTGVTISESTINDNGMNGIKLNSVTSATIDHNTIYDNGLAEIEVYASFNIDIYDNSIFDENYGVGIKTPGSESLEIYRNEMELSIHLSGSNSQIFENNFVNITGDPPHTDYDNVAIVLSGSYNTISDNTIYNANIGFVFLYGDYDYNTVENNTLTLVSDDLWYYTSGKNNTFINTELDVIDIAEDGYFVVHNYVDIEMLTVNGPATNVEMNIRYKGGSSIYSTDRYGGSDLTTDSSGNIERLFIIYKVFDGDYNPDFIETEITYYYDGAEYTIDLDTSISHSEKIWVNLRPVSSIDQINGVGDIPATGSEEAIKGADMVMVDSHTVAYWPFDEGVDQTVSDLGPSAYSGTIQPSAIWSEGRSNATDDYSVQFDGTFTNIDTDASFNNTEFTAEIWFKTISSNTMVLISDKDNNMRWGHNFYVDTGLGFDFTVNDGQIVRLTSSELVTDGEWHFAAVVRGSDYLELWLDGERVAETSWSGSIDYDGADISIGQNPLGANSLQGQIDDLRISDIARHNEDFMTGGGIVEFVSDSYDLDGEISEYIWTSALDEELGRGQTLYYPVDLLSEGSHTIELQVIDNNGTISDYDSYVLVVMERPDSEIVSISVNGVPAWSGWSAIEINSGDEVSFEGRTTSSQFISEFLWVSDVDGELSVVAEFSTSSLSNGTHVITFRLKGGNGLWSSDQTVSIDVNGRPDFGNPDVSEETISRLRSVMFKVKIEDDNTDGSELSYNVGYRIKGSTGEWQTDYVDDPSYNTETGELEFTFSPDENSPTGEYEFFVEATDEEGGASDFTVLSQSVTVQNNEPEIEGSNLDSEDGKMQEFTTGTTIELGVDATDEDGVVSTVIWYADINGDGEFEEIGTGQNFTYENNELPPGENIIKARVLDDEGGYDEVAYTVLVKEVPVEETIVDQMVANFSSNIPLIGLLSAGLIIVIGTVLLRRNRGTTEVEDVAEGLKVDDGVSEVRESFETLEWEIPTDAQGNALIIGEYMAKRRESYLTHPDNDEVIDYLHNNRERFTISSYFDVPAEPPVVLTDWALPDNLRGNVHLDSHRKQLVERITNSSPDKNFVIIGEPGVGKTVMLFEVFDRLMYQAPVGILSTDTIAKAHEMFGVRVFYDDIPENQKLVEALTDNEIKGVIVTSREADWKALPTEMQAKFDRLTVPLFNEMDMKQMIEKMMTFQSIRYNDEAVKMLAEYAEGSPIYVWSMVREMMHRSVKGLTKEYIQENSVKGMINYVAQLLQRLLKDGEEYRSGGLHALASLIFLSDHMEERYCNDYFFDAYVEVLSKYTEEKLDDKMNPKTLNLVLAYLPINDSVIRFPHDTWPDVLQGWGDMNPFSSELRMINRSFADSGLFQNLKKEVVKDVWDSTYERYKRTPSRQKNSFLALADTLFQNFTIDELKELGVDIDIVRQVASTYSHIPQAAKLISKIQAVLPQTVTRIINMQELSSEKGHAPYKIQEMYLIYNDGRMINSLMDEEAKVDSDIMSSMLTAINDFVKDSFQTSGNLGSIDYGENQIILERGKHTILASVVYGEANRDLRSRMGRALTKIEDEFKSKLKEWDGDVDSLADTKEYLEPVMNLSKSVTKEMIDELQALRDVGLKSSWSQVAGFVQVNLMINNYSKKQLKGAKLALEYGADYLKLVKTDPSLKYTVTEVDLKKVAANEEMSVTLYFEPLKSTQASLNVHMDYEAKGGQSSGVSTAVFERVDLYKEGSSLDVSALDTATKAEIVADATPVEVESTVGEVEVVESTVEEVEVMDEEIETIELNADVVDIEEADIFEPVEAEAEVVAVEAEVVEEEPVEPALDPGESGVDDILSKLGELDDPENAPKKKEKKSDDEEEDKSGMDDVLGKLDEL